MVVHRNENDLVLFGGGQSSALSVVLKGDPLLSAKYNKIK